MNFSWRPEQQQKLTKEILSYGEDVVTAAQGELKFAVGLYNMPLWTPLLEVLLEVCGRVRSGTIKQWRQEQLATATRFFHGDHESIG